MELIWMNMWKLLDNEDFRRSEAEENGTFYTNLNNSGIETCKSKLDVPVFEKV